MKRILAKTLSWRRWTIAATKRTQKRHGKSLATTTGSVIKTGVGAIGASGVAASESSCNILCDPRPIIFWIFQSTLHEKAD